MRILKSPPLRVAWGILRAAILFYVLAVMAFFVWYGPPFRVPAAFTLPAILMTTWGDWHDLVERFRELRRWRSRNS
jgi:hypothetical protein